MSSEKRNDVETAIKSLKANNFEVRYVEKAEDACNMILEMIPIDVTIERAGSMSVRQVGLLDKLRERGNKGLDLTPPPKPGERPFAEMPRTRNDILLVSSNAVTLDGKLVNVDGMGNRVSGMVYGIKKVILLIGVNKIVRDVDEALDRIKNVIAPYHAKYIGLNTPCAKTGECNDCNSPQRICNITTIIAKKPRIVDFTIIIVGEDLGLGWDPEWPEERIKKITSAYREGMEKFRNAFPPVRR